MLKGGGDDESPCLTPGSDLVASAITGFGPIPGWESGNALVAKRNAGPVVVARCKRYGGTASRLLCRPPHPDPGYACPTAGTATFAPSVRPTSIRHRAIRVWDQ